MLYGCPADYLHWEKSSLLLEWCPSTNCVTIPGCFVYLLKYCPLQPWRSRLRWSPWCQSYIFYQLSICPGTSVYICVELVCSGFFPYTDIGCSVRPGVGRLWVIAAHVHCYGVCWCYDTHAVLGSLDIWYNSLFLCLCDTLWSHSHNLIKPLQSYGFFSF